MKLKNIFGVIREKILLLFKNKKSFLIACVIILVLIAFVIPSDKSDKSDKNNESGDISKIYFSQYEDEVESEILKMLLSLDQIESASVMVVCDETEKIEYLKNVTETISGSGDSTSKTKTEDVAYEKNGSNSYPIVVSTQKPKVVGVWIVVKGISPSTKLAVIKSISSVLNIEESSISILQE